MKRSIALSLALTFATANFAAPDFTFANGTIGEIQSCVKTTELATGTRLVDFGLAAFGWLEIQGATGTVEVVLGEKLARDGRIDRKPGGTIRVTSTKATCTEATAWTRVPLKPDKRNTAGRNGAARAIRLPQEVGVILPFRYAEVPAGVDARRIAITWPMEQKIHWSAQKVPGLTPDQRAALDELFTFSTYSIRATSFAGVYVDGDRERIPYEGDIYINMLGQLYGVDGDPTLARKSIRHVLTYPTWPTEWKQHAILCVWEDWHFTGETVLAAECYDQLVREKLMMDRARPDGLLPADPKADLVDWPLGERDGYAMDTPANAVVNAFYYLNLCQMADLAQALGKIDDTKRFTEAALQLKTIFNTTFFDAEAGLYRDGIGTAHHSLHANVMALYANLVSAEHQAKVVGFIERKGMACSPYFAQYYLETLFRYGRRDAAIRLLTDRGPRSWLGMIDQGSTITMEAWSLKAKSNQDWNHAWGAAPANLLPRYLKER